MSWLRDYEKELVARTQIRVAKLFPQMYLTNQARLVNLLVYGVNKGFFKDWAQLTKICGGTHETERFLIEMWPECYCRYRKWLSDKSQRGK